MIDVRSRLFVAVVAVAVIVAGCAAVDDPEPAPGDVEETPDGEETPTPGPEGTPEDASGNEAVDGTLEVHAINVGQGDATLIVGPEETMLIDSADWRDDGETVIDYLEARGIDRIDYLVTTHPHAEHIGGHAAVIEYYETEKEGIGQVWDPGVAHTTQTYERYLDAVEEHDVDLIRAREGDEIPFDGAAVDVVNPPAGEDDDLHYNSLALRVGFGDTAFLFTGDAEADAEGRMIEEHGDGLAADVYHAGHHGSATSSSGDFLDVVGPEAVIVSSAYDSQYGHPHEEVLDRFAERDVAAYWTAVHGTIVFESDGESIVVHTQAEAPTEPGAIRDAPEVDAPPTAPVEQRATLEAVRLHPAVTAGPATGAIGA